MNRVTRKKNFLSVYSRIIWLGHIKPRCRQILFMVGGVLALLGLAVPGMAKSTDRQLVQAATGNDVASVRQLLKLGVNVDTRDERGRTALLAAVWGNHIEVARLLIEAGADVNAQDDKLDSPLLLAGAEGTLEILKLILQANPDFSLYNRFGGTALIPACERGHVEVVKTLLETKVDIDHINHLGWTALLEAVILGDGGPRHQEIVQLLADAGANVNIVDNDGVSPIQHARQKGFKEIVKILESAGAR
ncbi:MAG: hypothetical protein NPINA01_32370 [Nitrospinaceae bacterium]|nr:MAG: hypothetical protein NPINA01_32370 [Nitrospinaceae bacterium]